MVKQSNFQRWIATVSEASIEPLADGTHVPQRAKRIERDWASLNDKRFFCDFDDPEAWRCLQSMHLLLLLLCSFLFMAFSRSGASRLVVSDFYLLSKAAALIFFQCLDHGLLLSSVQSVILSAHLPVQSSRLYFFAVSQA
jgi:hypothetical protein